MKPTNLFQTYPNKIDTKQAKELTIAPDGDVMIHGLPNKTSVFGIKRKLKKDWTLGCVAVQSNNEIEEIWDIVDDGTTVEIRP